jgi:hypothetical protein
VTRGKVLAGPLCRNWRPHRDGVLRLSGRLELHPIASSAQVLGSIHFFLSLDTAQECHPVSTNAAGFPDMPFFPSVLLRYEPVAVRSKAALRRVAAKTRPSRKAGSRLPQRRAGVS